MILKMCTKCKIEKSIDLFFVKNSSKDGLASSCKMCSSTKESFNKWYLSAAGKAKFLFWRYQKKAISKNIPFDLTIERIEKAITVGICERTGIAFDLSDSCGEINPLTPSIDKIDSKGGYTLDNVQIVCQWYNAAKGTMSDDQLFEFMRYAIMKNNC